MSDDTSRRTPAPLGRGVCQLDPKIMHTCKPQLQQQSAAEQLEELIREIASGEA